MIALIVISMAVLLAGYRFYSGYLARLLRLDDGIDFVPAENSP